ncbi:MAG: alpha/beta hydrolase [Panacagrimonas sp.]
MPLNAQEQGLLQQMAQAGGKAFHEMQVSECRQTFAGMIAALPPSQAELAAVENRQIAGAAGQIGARVYTPQGTGPFPALVYFHGGGWVVGDLETHDGVCRELCAGSHAVVIAVDYRLAPEAPYPAAPQDCIAATGWVASNAAALQVDASRIAVGGDSAGGNLAAVTAQQLRGSDVNVCAQLLVYPVTRMDGVETQSMNDNAEGYFLHKKDMHWFLDKYMPAADQGKQVTASPILNADLSGLPPALVITAEYDPLRDEGEDYGKALQSAGVNTVISRYDGTIHGMYNLFPVLDQGRAAIDESCRWLKERFAG